MCLYPKLIKNKKYEPNKKNGGVVSLPKDPRCLWVPIGCQDCIECRKQKARDWCTRLCEEIKHNKNGKFVTLTFSTEAIADLYTEVKQQNELAQWNAIMDGKEIPPTLTGYKADNAAATLAIRRFLERWRKKYKKSVRHWLITEIGGKNWEHVHIHGIIWTDEKIEPIWQYGGVYLGRYREANVKEHWVNGQTAAYITKYITKIDAKHKTFRGKIHTSAGIGAQYTSSQKAKTNIYKKGETREYYRTNTGHKVGLPIYWRNKIYSEEQRELLWIEKLDSETRWICGEKIKFNGLKQKDRERLNEKLEYHRKRTAELGFGNNTSWKRKAYEEQYRNLMIKERISAKTNPHASFANVWAQDCYR